MATIKPKGVIASDKSAEIFQNIVANVYSNIFNIFQRTENIYKRARKRQILKELREIVQEGDDDLKAWVATTIPGYYSDGVNSALDEIYKRDNDIDFSSSSFVGVHAPTLKGIAEDNYNLIAQSMTTAKNSAISMLNDADRMAIIEELGKGYIEGKAREKIGKKIRDIIKKRGVTGLIDKGGKKWNLTTYGKMLSRTRLTQATNSGIINQAILNGDDLVRVSSHNGSCPLCMPFQFEILSISGRNNNYLTVETAREMGLFHPNCRHRLFVYNNRFESTGEIWDTEQQKFVPMTEYRKNNYNRKAFNLVSKHNKELYKYGKNSIVGENIWRATTGMETQYKMHPKYGLEPFNEAQIKHLVSDYTTGLKMDMGEYLPKNLDIDKYFNSALSKQKIKTLRQLKKRFESLTLSLRIPKNPLEKTINDLTKKAYIPRKTKIEKLFIINKKGEIAFSTTGSKNKISISASDILTAKNNIAIHNHPGNSSFSYQDLFVFSKANAKSARVYTDNYWYSIERPKRGWGNIGRKEMENIMDKIKQEILTEYNNNDFKGKSHIEIQNIVIKRMVGKLGWKYKEVKR